MEPKAPHSPSTSLFPQLQWVQNLGAEGQTLASSRIMSCRKYYVPKEVLVVRQFRYRTGIASL